MAICTHAMIKMEVRIHCRHKLMNSYDSYIGAFRFWDSEPCSYQLLTDKPLGRPVAFISCQWAAWKHRAAPCWKEDVGLNRLEVGTAGLFLRTVLETMPCCAWDWSKCHVKMLCNNCMSFFYLMLWLPANPFSYMGHIPINFWLRVQGSKAKQSKAKDFSPWTESIQLIALNEQGNGLNVWWWEHTFWSKERKISLAAGPESW